MTESRATFALYVCFYYFIIKISILIWPLLWQGFLLGQIKYIYLPAHLSRVFARDFTFNSILGVVLQTDMYARLEEWFLFGDLLERFIG